MMSIEDYAQDVGKSVEEILSLCDKLGIAYKDSNTMLDDTAIILLDNKIQEEENEPEVTATEEFYEDEFIVYLTIDGTSYDEVEVKITDPNKTIRDQINSIVHVFELPRLDNGGNPIQYLLGQIMDGSEEPEILEFEDEDGREQCLIDYNIQPGDYLHLISVPIAG